jgi:hypothetical protein
MAIPSEHATLSAQVVERVDLPELIPLQQVPTELPIRVHISLPYRWRKDGVHGVRLRAVKVPGCGWCTTREWLRQFIAEVTAARAAIDARPTSPRRRRLADAFRRARGGRR